MTDPAPVANPGTPSEALIHARAAALRAAEANGQSVAWSEEYWLLLARCERLTRRLGKVLCIADRYQASVHDLIDRLEQGNAQLRQLHDLGLPICRHCGRLHGDGRYLARVGRFLAEHPEAGPTQTICPDCLEQRYGPVPPRSPAPESRALQPPAMDVALQEARAILAARPTEGALADALAELAGRYERLLRRLNKLVLISDLYQAELHDSNLRLNQLANTDVLTGLSSRQAMRRQLEAAVRSAHVERRPLALLSLDVDHFKQVNDTLGHEAGDLVLVAMAAALLRDRRRADAVGRWGGEEFVLLLPDCGLADARLVAERLRERIAAQSVRIGDGQVSVTASIGVVALSSNETVNDLLRRADQAMYAAKQAGRDRVAG